MTTDDVPHLDRENMSEGERIFFDYYIQHMENRLHRFFLKVVIMFSVLGLTVGASFLYIDHVSNDNTTGLCALRTDAQQRIDQSEDFLKENPNGVPGISREQLERSTNNSRRTADALKGIHCQPDQLKVSPIE